SCAAVLPRLVARALTLGREDTTPLRCFLFAIENSSGGEATGRVSQAELLSASICELRNLLGLASLPQKCIDSSARRRRGPQADTLIRAGNLLSAKVLWQSALDHSMYGLHQGLAATKIFW